MTDSSPPNPNPNGPQAQHEALAQKIDQALDALEASSKRLGVWAESELDPLLESVAKFAINEGEVLEHTGQKLLDELTELRGELTAEEGALSGFAERVEELINQARKSMASEDTNPPHG